MRSRDAIQIAQPPAIQLRQNPKIFAHSRRNPKTAGLPAIHLRQNPTKVAHSRRYPTTAGLRPSTCVKIPQSLRILDAIQRPRASDPPLASESHKDCTLSTQSRDSQPPALPPPTCVGIAQRLRLLDTIQRPRTSDPPLASESHKGCAFSTQFIDRGPPDIHLRQNPTQVAHSRRNPTTAGLRPCNCIRIPQCLRILDASRRSPASGHPFASQSHNVCVISTQSTAGHRPSICVRITQGLRVFDASRRQQPLVIHLHHNRAGLGSFDASQQVRLPVFH